ncbi:MAG TPA: hypothetical protein VF074_16110 [Pyrinomonadaceae bacterium]
MRVQHLGMCVREVESYSTQFKFVNGLRLMPVSALLAVDVLKSLHTDVASYGGRPGGRFRPTDPDGYDFAATQTTTLRA